MEQLGRLQGGVGNRIAGQGRSPYNAQYTDAAGRTHNSAGWESVRPYGRYDIQVERIPTDNGSPYRGVVHALACRSPGHPTHQRLARTDHKPTAKPSASAAPCSQAGPTARSTDTSTRPPATGHR
jgi:hypothetical protein